MFAVPVNAIVEGMQPIELLMTNLLLVPVEPVVKLRRSIVEQLALELIWSLTILGVIAKCVQDIPIPGDCNFFFHLY